MFADIFAVYVSAERLACLDFAGGKYTPTFVSPRTMPRDCLTTSRGGNDKIRIIVGRVKIGAGPKSQSYPADSKILDALFHLEGGDRRQGGHIIFFNPILLNPSRGRLLWENNTFILYPYVCFSKCYASLEDAVKLADFAGDV